MLLASFSTPTLAQSTPSEAGATLPPCQASSLRSTSQMLRHISVRLLSAQGAGSGVIIHRQGLIYTVLTNAHVVDMGAPYHVLTVDGQTYEGWRLHELHSEYDLALIQFRSDRLYRIAQFRSDNITSGETVYAAGFPNWYFLSSTQLAETREIGFRAFQLTVGEVELVLSQPLQQGYQLGYTNAIVPGMSGGPILDCAGQLVGVNGGLSYPPQGRSAFVFANGTMPSERFFQQMEPLSWAIPISAIRQFFAPSTSLPI